MAEPLKSNTPRTEEMIKSCGDHEKAYHWSGRFAEFARGMERELAVAAQAEKPVPLGYVLVELDRLNNLIGRIKALAEANSADAKSLAADAALLLQPKGETT